VTETSRTAWTAPNERLTPSIVMLAKSRVLPAACAAVQRVCWIRSFSFSSVSLRFAPQLGSS
jgi:hypothetical protein